MAFDFFNTSNLAFGAKLTRAFKQLNDLLDAAEEHLTVVYGDLYIYGEYIDRNYLVPVPNRPDAACQAARTYFGRASSPVLFLHESQGLDFP